MGQFTKVNGLAIQRNGYGV